MEPRPPHTSPGSLHLARWRRRQVAILALLMPVRLVLLVHRWRWLPGIQRSWLPRPRQAPVRDGQRRHTQKVHRFILPGLRIHYRASHSRMLAAVPVQGVKVRHFDPMLFILHQAGGISRAPPAGGHRTIARHTGQLPAPGTPHRLRAVPRTRSTIRLRSRPVHRCAPLGPQVLDRRSPPLVRLVCPLVGGHGPCRLLAFLLGLSVGGSGRLQGHRPLNRAQLAPDDDRRRSLDICNPCSGLDGCLT
jgi:hypothetical protein